VVKTKSIVVLLYTLGLALVRLAWWKEWTTHFIPPEL
jgi:hypothetical protein